MRKVYKLFGIKRMYRDWYQHKTSEGKYIDTEGYGYLVKGVYFNGAKIKAVYKDDKVLAFKYIFGCIKDVIKNMVSFKRLERKQLILE